MSKKTLLALGVMALAIAGCNSRNINNLIGGPTPTPAPTAVPTATTTTVTAQYNGTKLTNLPVSEYANGGTSANPSPGTLIATQNTDSTGAVTFSALTPGATYCWQYTYQPAPPPAQTVTATKCTNNWAGGLTLGS